MVGDRDNRSKEIFEEAIEHPPEEREAFLAEACGGDAELLDDVESLLRHLPDDDARLLVSAPEVSGAGEGLRAALREGADGAIREGETIDRYKLLEQLGEGAFGTVWAAEQREPVKRRVALKIIKLGMDTKQVIARFEAERQALALMDHPSIARVFDAGSIETGRPYFVMELVRGTPIVEYCDTAKMDTTSRLELFIKVCQAIQHAHQKGVIHRDIKSSNVLVTLHDGVPVPKVIDFGVAKATNAELTQKTLYTRHLQMVGTPAYMSPEQAEMSGLDIDTRSDIYSLGVLLYELLTGTRPFDSEAREDLGLPEVLRIIREEAPLKPSTRLSSLGETATRTAERRRTDVKKLGLMLRGELDWIVMTCLEKDRTRRYQTANALAADVRRHLDDEPVVARPPSAGYRLGKFVRRHRAELLACSLIAAALTLGLVGTTYGMLEAKAARAEEAKRADELQLVADFQSQQLASVDAAAMGVQLRQSILDEAPDDEREALSERLVPVNFTDIALGTLEANVFGPSVEAIDTQFEDQPLLRARLLQSVAVTKQLLGLLDEAQDPLERAVSIRRAALGDEHPDTLTARNRMCELLIRRGELAKSESYCAETLEIGRPSLGDEHPEVLTAISNVGIVLASQGKLEDAEPYYRESLEGRRRVLEDDDLATLSSVNNMGFLLKSQGRLEEAEPYYREAVESFRRVLGDDEPETATAISNLGLLLQSEGKIEEAEPYYREALESLRRSLGDDHPKTLSAINNMGFLLKSQGRLEEAETHLREALEGRRRVLGDDHPSTLSAINNMGALLQSQGRLEEAEQHYREALEGRRRVLGGDHPRTLSSILNLVAVLIARGRNDTAELLGREAVETGERLLGAEHWRVAVGRSLLGEALAGQGRHDEAEELLLEAYSALDASLAVNQRERELPATARRIVTMYESWGRDEQAEAWRGRAAGRVD